MDLRPKKRPSEASEAIEGSQSSRGRRGEENKMPKAMSSQRKRAETAYSGWEEKDFTINQRENRA